jgi:1-acyl-sn-glycerol-3-phosphate acyltransferase
MAALRSLLYAAIFYPATVLWVLAGLVVSVISKRLTLGVVRSWADMHHWLVTRVLGIELRVEGEVPSGPHLFAVKHESMLETVEMVRLARLPVIVIKKELADMPLFGLMTRRYGVIPIDRGAGAKALRALVEAGKEAMTSGRPVVIYPEGTRVAVGETPPLKSGFTALYRVLGLPVAPVAVDSGRLWGRGFIHRSGIVTFKFGAPIAGGLSRDDIQTRTFAAINALESGA